MSHASVQRWQDQTKMAALVFLCFIIPKYQNQWLCEKWSPWFSSCDAQVLTSTRAGVQDPDPLSFGWSRSSKSDGSISSCIKHSALEEGSSDVISCQGSVSWDTAVTSSYPLRSPPRHAVSSPLAEVSSSEQPWSSEALGWWDSKRFCPTLSPFRFSSIHVNLTFWF